MGGTQHSKEYCPKPSDDEISQYILSRDGLYLFTFKWADLPEGKQPIGVVFLCHGVGEHITRPGYHAFAKSLNAAGFVVFGMDHQGHGRSNGERCYAPSFQSYMDDYLQFMEEKGKDYPDLPKFLFGHSMGSLVSASLGIYLLEKNKASLLKAIVLSASPVLIDPKLDNGFNRGLAKAVSFVAPKWAPPVGDKLDVRDLSRDPEAVQRYVDDPLIYKGYFRAAQANGMLEVSSFLQNNAQKFSFPILLIHGSEDKISRPIGSEFFYKNCSSTDKRVKIFEGQFHEPFEDPDKDKIFDEVVQFLIRKVNGVLEEKAEEEEKKEEQTEERKEQTEAGSAGN